MRERDEWRARRRRDDGRDLDAPDPALERFAERIAAPLRAPERADATFRARLMASVRAEAELAEPAPATGGAAAAGAPREPWYRRSVTVRLTPLRGLAAAAAIGGVMLVGARALERGGGATAATPRVARSAPLPDTVRVVQFVFVAPGARRVAVVGDFNAWDRDATQLQRGGVNGGVWTVSLALPAGRHEYAFVVDGERWEPDPAATDAVTDDFGVVSSVVSVRAAAPRLGAT